MLSLIKNFCRNIFTFRPKAKIPAQFLSIPLLNGLNRKHAKLVELEAGDAVFVYNQKATEIYVIEYGDIALVDHDQSPADIPIAQLTTGEILGEASLTPGNNYGFTAIARQPSRLWRIPTEVLNIHTDSKSSEASTRVNYDFLRTVSVQLHHNYLTISDRLHERDQLLKRQNVLAQFMMHMFIILSLYIFIYAGIYEFGKQIDFLSIVSSFFTIVFSIITLHMMKSTQLPLSFYGLTLKGWRFAIKDTLLFTIPLLVLLYIGGILLHHFYPVDYLINLLRAHSISSIIGGINIPLSDYSPLIRFLYVLLIPFQELMARGALQTVLSSFMTGRLRLTKAILVSNLVFAGLHVHGGLLVAAVAFLFGVFWGILYARQKTLLGATLSHLLIGALSVYADIF